MLLQMFIILRPINIAKEIIGTKDTLTVMEFVNEHLSEYSAQFRDEREIISECFVAHYTEHIHNSFADCFVEKCRQISKGVDSDENVFK